MIKHLLRLLSSLWQPPSVEALLTKAVSETLKGNHRKALELYGFALQYYPQDIRPILEMGNCYAQMHGENAWSKAIACYQVVLDMDPNNNIAQEALVTVRQRHLLVVQQMQTHPLYGSAIDEKTVKLMHQRLLLQAQKDYETLKQMITAYAE